MVVKKNIKFSVIRTRKIELQKFNASFSTVIKLLVKKKSILNEIMWKNASS